MFFFSRKVVESIVGGVVGFIFWVWWFSSCRVVFEAVEVVV